MKKLLLPIFIISLFTITTVALAAGDDCSLKTGSVLRFGTKSSNIKTLQNCLVARGYDTGGTSGAYGPKTRQAVQMFYENILGITSDGNAIGPKGIAALVGKSVPTGSGSAVKNTPTGYRYAKNEADFKKYITDNRVITHGAGVVTTAAPSMAAEASSASLSKSVTTDTVAARVSSTNVQVAGIDEPDIIKTDGKNLYMAKPSYWYGGGIVPMPMVRETDGAVDSKMAIWAPYPVEPPKTQIIGIRPIADMALISEQIDTSGEMLYAADSQTLMVFTGRDVIGYNVANPKAVVKKWMIQLDQNTSLVTSRLHNNDLYMVTTTYMNTDKPCPIVPLMQANGTQLSIACTRVLVPEVISPVSQVYTALTINPATGNVTNKTSIAENGYGATVAMFENNLYLATQFDGDYYRVYNAAYITAVSKYVPTETLSKIKKIQSYDISDAGKQSEIQNVVYTELNKMDNDKRLTTETNIRNAVDTEIKKQIRNLYKTKITRIALSNMSIAATGTVPGNLVNQFALDEYRGHLRVATTVGQTWDGTSANDIYVLGMNLRETGSIQNLGLTERIYSVRFMGDTGYLVTFRQTDPFYVLDLKNPAKPVVAGELKIPGYSSYLEDLGNGYVLGLGREGSDLKLSLFNVKNPKTPTEDSKYILKNAWSEAEHNHRAFLRDDLHNVFFIPGGDGGYIFSYADGAITLKTAVAGTNVKRAIYVNNYMYVIADDKITVLDETTWERIKEFQIK
jgi:inhibitor of cysteine peptidase